MSPTPSAALTASLRGGDGLAPTTGMVGTWAEDPQQFLTLLADAGIGLWEFEVATRRFTCTPQMLAVYGLPADLPPDGLMERINQLVHPDDFEELATTWQRASVAGEAFVAEYRIRRASDDAERWLRTRGFPRRKGPEAAGRDVGMVVDITEVRAQEAIMRTTTRELERAQRLARVGSWSWDMRTNGVWWSPNLWSMFEIDPSVPASVDALRAVFPRDQQAVYDEAVRRAVEENAPYDLEVGARLPSGRDLVVRAIGDVERLADGTPVGMHGAVQDVTAERARDRERAEAERAFRTLATAGPAGVFRTDADGHVVYANDRLLSLWRMSLDGFRTAWRTRVHPDDIERVLAAGAEAVTSATPFRARYRIVVEDGVRHLRVTSSPVVEEGARYGGQVGIVEDVTDEVVASEREEQFAAELRHAQKLESLGVVAGGIAHDFNNLLVGVLTNAELALSAMPPGAAARDLVTNIERAAQRAADLTRQLLAYSGRGRLAVGAVELSDVVREMADLLRTVVSKRARVVLDLARGLPAIEGDATQLRQLVMNLITNASDALGDRDGTITLRTRPGTEHDIDGADVSHGTLAPARSLVALEVIDDGAGMDAPTLQRIFDPFFTTKFTGRGLGLSAVQGIVRGHGGVMALFTRPGAGTRFVVLLPGTTVAVGPGGADAHADAPPNEIFLSPYAADLPAPSPSESTAPARAATGVTTASGRLLIVDDDMSVRSVLARMLTSRGFVVEQAENGRVALASVAEQPTYYSAVLLDLTMPEMNGRETFDALVAIAPTLPVIMMSGYSEDEMAAGGTHTPAAILQKPFTANEVMAVLDRCLGR